jgi:hypothetical protein
MRLQRQLELPLRLQQQAPHDNPISTPYDSQQSSYPMVPRNAHAQQHGMHDMLEDMQ